MPGPNSADTEREPPGVPPSDRDGRAVGNRSGEFAAIERIAAVLSARVGGPPAGELWIGDDTAVLAAPRGRLLLTTDVAVAGVHADLGLLTAADLGWRAMAASVSDVAAMGGVPLRAVVAVAGPPDSDLDGLAEGLADAAAALGCPVVGGDLSGGPALTVAVAVTGEVPDPPGPVLRSGARPGDHVFVTGPLGASSAGLRVLRDAGGRAAGIAAGAEVLVETHCRPRARTAEGVAARDAGASAMVDVSDGLAADLGHVCDASGVGVRLDQIPVQSGATLEDALGGGEDYELVVVTPDGPGLVHAFTRAGLQRPLHIGICVADVNERTIAGQPMTVAGWQHGFDGRPTSPA